MFLRSACCAVALLPTVWLGGCADSMPDAKPLKQFSDLIHGYDQTLNKTQKAAVISELQTDKQRQQELLGKDEVAEKSSENQR
jgi:hypothetical protein